MVQMEPLLATRPKAASKVSMNFTNGNGLGVLLLHSHLPTQTLPVYSIYHARLDSKVGPCLHIRFTHPLCPHE